MACYLAESKYGKGKVRVFRVVREEDKVHQIVEYNVQVLLEGDLEKRQAAFSNDPRRGGLLKEGDSYTEADNSVVVATDSIKNVIYCKWT
jgi:urate oxidase